MTQVAVAVQTNARVFIYLKPKPSIQSPRGLQVTSGVHQVELGHPLHPLIANFTKNLRFLLKRKVVTHAERNPLALLLSDEETAHSAGTALQVPCTPSPAKASAADQDSSYDKSQSQVEKQSSSLKTEQAATREWRDQVDLSLIECGMTRTRIYDMLALHASMWNGRF